MFIFIFLIIIVVIFVVIISSSLNKQNSNDTLVENSVSSNIQNELEKALEKDNKIIQNNQEPSNVVNIETDNNLEKQNHDISKFKRKNNSTLLVPIDKTLSNNIFENI